MAIRTDLALELLEQQPDAEVMQREIQLEGFPLHQVTITKENTRKFN